MSAIMWALCSQRSSAFLRRTWFALFVLARDKVHITPRDFLIVIPDTDCCVGAVLGRACAVPWLPAGRLRVRQL